MRTRFWVATPAVAAVVLAAAVGGAARPDDDGLDGDGFVQKWLVLAPIPLGADANGDEELGKEQVPGEAGLKPKAGDKVKAGDKDLVWKEHTCPDHLVDLNAIAGGETEDSVAYAVTYVVAPEDAAGVTMKTGTDDQAKVYLNGKEVFKHEGARATEKDQDDTEVKLKKGTNVLVVKVVNEKMEWSFCVRFCDKDGNPVKGLKAQTKP